MAVASAAAPKKKEEDAGGPKGYVLLRVAKNTTAVAREARDLTDVVVVSDGPEVHAFRLKLLPGTDHTRTFGSWLPVGRYRVRDVTAHGMQALDETHFHISPPEYLGAFEVRAGELTWLDTLMYQPLGGRESTLVHVRSGVDGRAVLAQLAPDAVASIADQPAIEWHADKPWSVAATQPELETKARIAQVLTQHVYNVNTDPAIESLRNAKSEDEFLAKMKKAPGQLNGSYVLADGTALFGSSFGQILKRAPSGGWSTIDIGCVCDILSLHVKGDALYVGTEFGAILRSTDGGATFTQIARLVDGSGIAGIVALGDGEWMVSTVLEFPPRALLRGFAYSQRRAFYLLTDLAQLASTPPVRAFEGDYDNWFHINGMNPPLSAGPTPQGFAALEGSTKLHRYDAGSKTWQVTELPKKAYRLSFTQSGSVLFSEDAGVRSLDGGATWRKIDKTQFAYYQSTMYDTANGFRMKFSPFVWDDAETYFTTDGGVSWRHTGKREGFYCPAFGTNQVRGQVYCIGDDNVIRASERGDKWTEEPMAK